MNKGKRKKSLVVKCKSDACSDNFCPCLNSDYEYGASCNLDYDTNLYWFRKSDDIIVKDTPEMRSHQQDFDLKNASMNCGLIKIKCLNKTILPLQLPQPKRKG